MATSGKQQELYATTASNNYTSIPVHKIYQHLLNSTLPIIPFDIESTENTDSIWTLFAHLEIYGSTIGLLITVRIGLFYCYFFWC